MTKKILTKIFGSLLVCALFMGLSANQVMANEEGSAVKIQQKSKYVSVVKEYREFPPPYIFYNSGVYQGYLYLASYKFNGTYYTATYKGNLYDGPPYPYPNSYASY